MNDMTGSAPIQLYNSSPDARRHLIAMLAAGGLLSAALVWSYWSTLIDLTRDWRRDENYSAGQLVPLASLYLVWQERKTLAGCWVRVCWWGAGLILLGQLARAYGLLFLYESAERYSMVVTVAGVVMLVAGSEVFHRLRWVLLFLFLMVPLPGQVHNAVSGPMQDQATAGAVFFLELIGLTVAREGNVILLNDVVPLTVAEACSGLRMLTAFVVVGCVLAYLVNRPAWQRVVLVVSTVPVAIACNLVRLVITAVLFLVVSGETAEKFFHDFAGWTMMPMAVACLALELWLMSRLVLPEEPVLAPRVPSSVAK